MADDASRLTWIERAQRDPSLRAPLDADFARGGIALDLLRYQHRINTQRVAVLIAQLDAAPKTITTLRRYLGRQRADGVLNDVAEPDRGDAA